VFGEFRYGAARPGSDDIRILGGWQQANIKPVEIPEIAGVKGAPAAGRAWVHRLVVEQVRGLFTAWDEAALVDRILTWESSSPHASSAAVARSSRTTPGHGLRHQLSMEPARDRSSAPGREGLSA